MNILAVNGVAVPLPAAKENEKRSEKAMTKKGKREQEISGLSRRKYPAYIAGRERAKRNEKNQDNKKAGVKA